MSNSRKTSGKKPFDNLSIACSTSAISTVFFFNKCFLLQDKVRTKKHVRRNLQTCQLVKLFGAYVRFSDSKTYSFLRLVDEQKVQTFVHPVHISGPFVVTSAEVGIHCLDI